MSSRYGEPPVTTAAERLAFWKALDERLAATGAQFYMIGDKQFRMPEPEKIAARIAQLQLEVDAASGPAINIARLGRVS